jgi:ATP-dependent DNA ligase
VPASAASPRANELNNRGYSRRELRSRLSAEQSTPASSLVCHHAASTRAMLCAFDLLEVNGEDIRREPIEDRKRRLAGLLRLPHDGIALNEAFGGDGAMIYKHACALNCEGIVSKRLGSPYRAGRSAHWLKVENPAAPAVHRLEEEDWA